jgi:4-amino-4-deoxy-L-arabinose transferase-like glycosyltransferase
VASVVHLPTETSASLTVLLRKYRGSLILCGLLFAIALILRLPNLMHIPVYSDEGLEVLWGLDIALGRRLPLTAYDPYDGPLFPYLLAGLFKVLGVSLEVPRLMVAVFGALTVVATYWLGRVIGDHRSGLVAACLALTSTTLVIQNSHYGWSNSLTPFFSTVMLALLVSGVIQRKPIRLALAGLFAALTLQTHPISGIALPGILLWFVSRPDFGEWRKERAARAALGFFGLGYAPMILANARPDLPLLTLRVARTRTYAFAPTINPIEYLSRIGELVKNLLDVIGGAMPPAIAGNAPVEIATGILLLTAVVYTWRYRTRLIGLVLISSLLILPTTVKEFAPRYIAFLAPPAFAAIGILASESWHSVARLISKKSSTGPRLLDGAMLVAIIIPIFLVAQPLVKIPAYYQEAYILGNTNSEYFRFIDVVKENGACGMGLFLENIGKPLTNDAWFSLFAMDYVLTLESCPHSMLPDSEIIQALGDRGQGGWVIMLESSRAAYSQGFDLEPVTTAQTPLITHFVPITLFQVRAGPRYDAH